MNITVLSAGAGSGKTYTLTGKLVELLSSGVRPAGILATTFTKKAAAELQERVRVRLLEAGQTEAANELGQALIGTVHSIGVRLLQRFAFEAGMSPLVEIIAEGDEQRLFNESLSQVLTENRIEALNTLAEKLGLSNRKFGEAYDWRRDIRDLTDAARANNFSRETLEESKRRSWQSFEQLLPPVQSTDPVVWNNRLISLIDQTLEALDANTADETKKTRDTAEMVRSMQNQLRWRGELYWKEWAKIAKSEVAVKSRELYQPLRDFAASHDEHRLFRADVKNFIELLFDVATDALTEYEEYKRKRGLIDYTDMECYVSRLLRIESVRNTLREELDLLLVDEFQDTSPIQLDIFLQLSALARQSIWVGDPKQSIYGFRGAEPALMKAVVDATGGIREENILKKSWRSRADLVHLSNAIFTRAFSDLPAEQIVLVPSFTKDKELNGADRNAIVHWHFRSELDERKTPGSPWLENCIADQLRVLLEQKWPVYNKKRNQLRPVQAGDIAVLCRSNKACQDMAEALHRAGLQAAIARTGLLDTPEARLVMACLKYLVTPSDALSIAEIRLLIGHKNLAELTEERLNWLYRESAGRMPWASDDPFMQRLSELRPLIADLSASEILNLLLDELDLRRIIVRFGNTAQRLDNVDVLRGYALDYESACQRLHSAASLGGFLLWLDALARNDRDQQGSGETPEAIKVLTYHKSKGLEYPVTVCCQLSQGLKEKIWGLNLVSEVAQPDLDNILAGRWLRYWMHPYGDQLAHTRLDETVRQSEAWVHATRQALDEEVRLLYVGLTRARDYLILPTTTRATGWLNRVCHNGDESIPTLDPDSCEMPFEWQGEYLKADTQIFIKPRDFPEHTADEAPVRFHAPHKGRHPVAKAAYLIDVVKDPPPGFQCAAGDPMGFADPLPFDPDDPAPLAKAVLSFLMADDPRLSAGQRRAMAQKQLDIRQVKADLFLSETLVQYSDAFRAMAVPTAAPPVWAANYPLRAMFGKRLAELNLHFYLEFSDRILLLQAVETFDASPRWKTQAQLVAPPLAWAGRILRQLHPDKTIEYRALFPLHGQVLPLTIS